MAIFQATSTQNDMVTAYYVMCSIYFSLILRQKITLSALIGLGISVGIALLTKGTAYVYLAPLLLWVTLSLFLKENFRAIYKLSIAGSIAILLIAPHFLRNLSTFNSLTGPHSELYTNDTVSLAYTTSNILRNISLNYSAPINAPSLILASQQIGAVFVAIHEVLGLPLNDTGSTWSATRFFFPVISLVPFGEDAAPAPIHVSFIIVALFVIAYKRKFSLLAQYTLVCVGMFILFSLILRWQAWHTRLHLPMLMASMPFVAIALNKLLMWAMLALVFIFGIVWLLMTPNRSFITPNMSQSVLFAPRTQLQGITDSYLDLSRNALEQGCPIGFYFRTDTPVYLFLNALKQLSPNGEIPETGYIFVDGAEAYNPCVIIANIPLPETESHRWYTILELDGFNLWVKFNDEQVD
jgi:4-amino-4-deoxy-L-arabinose transferase-like glycosyltransferase